MGSANMLGTDKIKVAWWLFILIVTESKPADICR